ncbi:MAG: radical SAM protein [Candidatus Omnitrophica bacterium]|nr:radical SAM protein [Candidatus Omnitrophota bacterium]
MKIISIQEAYKLKFERQKKIKELEYHAAGHCVHIGKISPGCCGCFVPTPFRYHILCGPKCNLNCLYCFYRFKEKNKNYLIERMVGLLRESRLPNYSLKIVSFSGGGEPLLYIDDLRKYMKFFRDVEQDTGQKPWYYLYTNGVLADSDMLLQLKDLGFDEIRFHLGASNFSKEVYLNLKRAVSYFKVVTVETPSWPPHREKLFEMLPIIDNLGVKHLNLGEIEITKYNYNKIAKVLPRGEIYQCYEMHLYDGGLTYDIIEEVLKNKYSYSVLDCSCFVKSIQRGNAKLVDREDIKGLIAKY